MVPLSLRPFTLFAKVAVPFVAAIDVSPPRVAPLEVTVIVSVVPGTRLPEAS